ncbi:MAG: type 1 glutamine amidotransferase [Dehalococcoidia bacterium]|nr:type 1 glutamine amidotransferase [Dehalococcoidia bacterium]
MLEGKRVAILVEEGYEDSELVEPVRAMKDAGARIIFIGNDMNKTYKGKRGVTSIHPDTTADKIGIDEFDAIIIPGGHAPEKMRLYQAMIDLVKKAFETGKIIAAVCHGPQLLISADILKGRRVTSWPSIAVDLENAGANWIDAPVIRDGSIITSRKPADLPKFNKAIVEALLEVKTVIRSRD